MHLAETDDQAFEEFLPAQYDAFTRMEHYRTRWNPAEYPMERQTPPMNREGYAATPNPEAAENIIGSPQRVAEQLAQMRDAGIRNLMLTNRGLMSKEKTAKSLETIQRTSDAAVPRLKTAVRLGTVVKLDSRKRDSFVSVIPAKAGIQGLFAVQHRGMPAGKVCGFRLSPE